MMLQDVCPCVCRCALSLALALVSVNSVLADGSAAAGQRVSVAVVSGDEQPWKVLSQPLQQNLEQALAERFAPSVEGDVAVHYCAYEPVARCAQPLSTETKLVIELAALTEAEAPTGLSFSFGVGDPRSGDVGASVVLPISCTLPGSDNPAHQVRQAVDPERLQADALDVDYLAKRLFQACHGLLASDRHSTSERSYTEYPGVYLERQQAPPAEAVAAGSKETVYLFRNLTSEVTFQLGNNGLNR